MPANPGWPGGALRTLAAWLTAAADRFEAPVARPLALEPAPLAPTAEDRLAEMRSRAHVPYY